MAESQQRASAFPWASIAWAVLAGFLVLMVVGVAAKGYECGLPWGKYASFEENQWDQTVMLMAFVGSLLLGGIIGAFALRRMSGRRLALVHVAVAGEVIGFLGFLAWVIPLNSCPLDFAGFMVNLDNYSISLQSYLLQPASLLSSLFIALVSALAMVGTYWLAERMRR